MADWALGGSSRVESFGVTGGASFDGATAVTSNAATNTKGVWAQLIASTSFDAVAIMVDLSLQYGDTNFLVDIGIGAAGSEQVLIANLMLAWASGTGPTIVFPLAIPAGSRLSARCQDNFGGSAAYVSGRLFSGGFATPPPCNTVTTYGAVLTTSSGTIADAGGTANTRGAWTQLVASTTQQHKQLLVAAVRPVQSTVIGAYYSQLADIGVGAAASEKIILPDLRSVANTTSSATSKGSLSPGYFLGQPCDIPTASRLAARLQSTSILTPDRTCAFVVYGMS